MELMQASREWATRPADERFTSLHELGAFQRHQRQVSKDVNVSSRLIEVLPDPNDELKGLAVRRKNGEFLFNPTHWSFGQLATLGGAPAGYLRGLPAPLAADCINYGLHVERDVEDVKLLLRKNGKSELAAATGPKYGRVWNTDITEALIRNFGDGVSGDWKVPGEFGKDVAITKNNTTLYASDRDMFVFLADEHNRVTMHNRRPGHGETSLARGFFVWNSEVGGGTLGIAAFLFDYVCMNRIVWGAQDVKFIKIRHTVSAPDRFIEEVRPLLDNYAHSSARTVEETIAAAQAARLDTSVADFLKNRRYSTQAIAKVENAHTVEEGRPMETLWDVVTGITAAAKSVKYQNERVEMERDAGKILDLVAVR